LALKAQGLPPARSPLSDHRLKVLVLLDSENLLNTATERCGGRGEPSSQRLKLPGTFVPIHLSGPDLLSEDSHLFHERVHLLVHGNLQLLNLGQLVLRQP
jgi:hypothetical protein